jgi:hypothetical protein
MCKDDKTAITGDELRCTKRKKNEQCVSTARASSERSIQLESGDRSARISTGRVESCMGKGIVQKG